MWTLACVQLMRTGRILDGPSIGRQVGLGIAYFATPFLALFAAVALDLAHQPVGWALVLSTVWVVAVAGIAWRRKAPALQMLVVALLGLVLGPVPLMVFGLNLRSLVARLAALAG